LAFGDYIIYVDESGSPNLKDIDPQNPLFTLAFCIFNKTHYTRQIVPEVQDLKFRFWGEDGVIFRSYDIRKERGPFSILRDPAVRLDFVERVNATIAAADFTLIAAVIRKDVLVKRYVDPGDPYEIAMTFCMERTARWLDDRHQGAFDTHIVFEQRGQPADSLLELAFRRVCDGANQYKELPNMKFVLRDKKHNSTGLQFADLVAYPVSRKVANPAQANRAYDIIRGKFRRSYYDKIEGYGLKVFP
jgi:hypothetical protein